MKSFGVCSLAVCVVYFSTIMTTSAQNVIPCVDVKINLTKGAESESVISLQKFLYSKGFLKVAPNGYFGPGTMQAVKVYQKSAGLPPTGAVFAMTRLAIRNATCNSVSTSTIGTALPAEIPPSFASSTGSSPVPLALPVLVNRIRPVIISLDKGTLFKGATTTWGIVINGSAFSDASNTVYFRSRESGRVYRIGVFPSVDKKTILLPPTITKNSFSCGSACSEALPIGTFDMTVQHEGGESDPIFLAIKGFSISSTSGSLNTPVQNGSNQFLGTISYAPSVPLYVTNLDLAVVVSGLGGGNVSNLTFRDEISGKNITTFGSQVASDENQSKIIGVYGTVGAKSSGSITISGTITAVDYIGNKPVQFQVPTFLTTLVGY